MQDGGLNTEFIWVTENSNKVHGIKLDPDDILVSFDVIFLFTKVT